MFNGGPGAASAFLHLGLVGPRVAEFGAGHDGADAASSTIRTPGSPSPISCWSIRSAPAGAGRPSPTAPAPSGACAATPRRWRRSSRSTSPRTARRSPKYILGESYGGFRAAKVARALQSDAGHRGVGHRDGVADDRRRVHVRRHRFALGAALQLPSLVATELERKGTFSKEALAEAEHFALTEYLTTLAGPSPNGEAAKAFYARVAQITGLPVEVVARSRGFIRDAYIKNLRAAEGKIVSRYDATFAGPILSRAGESARAGSAARRRHPRLWRRLCRLCTRRARLQDRDDLPAGRGNLRQWDWDDGSAAAASADDDLRELLALTPSFRLMIAHGYSDMATPYAVSRYVLDHLPPSAEEERAELKLYRGGHMFYIDRSRATLSPPTPARCTRRHERRCAAGRGRRRRQPVHSGAQGRHSRGADRARRICQTTPSGKNSGGCAGCSPRSITTSISRARALRSDYYYFNPEIEPHAALDHASLERAYADLVRALDTVLKDANFVEVPHDGDRRGAQRAHRAARRGQGAARRFPRGAFLPARPARRDVSRSPTGSAAQAQIEAQVYDDVVLIVAMKPQAEIGSQREAKALERRKIRPGSVLIKYFRNIASGDLNALFPNVRVVMSTSTRCSSACRRLPAAFRS